MEYFHIRYTGVSFPESIVKKFDQYLLVSHIGVKSKKFHYHIVGQLNVSVKTIQNNSVKWGGNAVIAKCVCDEKMYRYILSPKSQPTIIKYNDLKDEQIQTFKDESEEYLRIMKENSKVDKDNIAKKIFNIVRPKLEQVDKSSYDRGDKIDKYKVIIYKGIYQFCMKNKNLVYNRSISATYMHTILGLYDLQLGEDVYVEWVMRE